MTMLLMMMVMMLKEDGRCKMEDGRWKMENDFVADGDVEDDDFKELRMMKCTVMMLRMMMLGGMRRRMRTRKMKRGQS